ncbi:DUF1573 domain-containing protein [Candidatus Uhrbacteria bacterium]|nr:DUF1573 domain-containing protein [Candidatus Uhrbacteria bacterium]
MNRLPILLTLAVVLLVGSGLGALLLFTNLSNEPAPAHLLVNPASVDLGDIPQDGGIVSSTVTIKNDGGLPLEIFRLSTSCGCTTADMDASPLAPGDERTLTIRFNPMTHPDESGPITRVVYVQTSDPTQPEMEINVTGVVIPITERL